MMDDFIRDLHHLQKADSLIGKIWLKLFARQFGLFAFAGLIAALGFTMTNIAGFYGLQAPLGPVWAAVVVAIGDFILAAVGVQAARNSEPGPEMALALDTRKMAIEAIQADARDIKITIDTFGQDIRDTKDAIAGFVQNPLDATVQNLLIPAATSIIKGLGSKKDQA
jgi:hypothetical protein